MRVTVGVVRAIALATALLAAPYSVAMVVFSGGGYGVPETISLAPVEFGNLGGSYLIPDALTSNIWVVPSTGGAPVPLLANPVPETGNSIVGGTFLPAGWGSNSGRFLTASFGSPGILTFDAAGAQQAFDATQSVFTTPLIAPTTFPNYGGNLFVTDQNNKIWRAMPDSTASGLTLFKDFQGGPFEAIAPFGIEFTPAGWGNTFGNRLLVSDTWTSVDNGPGTRSSYIVAVAPDGTASLFATIPLKDSATPGTDGQYGLRQMVLAPNDYFKETLGIRGQLLLVSVSGSPNGQGVLGDILALDSSGTIVASLRDDLGLTKFDPRGMLFTVDGTLLISDTSDPVWAASASDFQRASAPVPSTLTLVLPALGALCMRRRRNAYIRKQRKSRKLEPTVCMPLTLDGTSACHAAGGSTLCGDAHKSVN